jgi:hypothetical protein
MGNRSFETAGVTVGSAQDWSYTGSAGGLAWAIFGSTLLNGCESFERGFDSNEDALFAYASSDIAWALCAGLSWEHFEKGYSVADVLGASAAAQKNQVLTGKQRARIELDGSEAPPWVLQAGELLTYKVDGGATTSLKIVDGMFKSPVAIYPWEMAQVLQANMPGVDVRTDGSLLLLFTSQTSGAAASLQILGGAVATALGLPVSTALGADQTLLWRDGHVGVLTTVWDNNTEEWADAAEDFMSGWKLPGFDHTWTHDNFETFWDAAEEEWRYLSGHLAWASISPGAVDVDAFESGWRGNEDYISSYPTVFDDTLQWAGLDDSLTLQQITGATANNVRTLDAYQFTPKLWLTVVTAPSADVVYKLWVEDNAGHDVMFLDIAIPASSPVGTVIPIDLADAQIQTSPPMTYPEVWSKVGAEGITSLVETAGPYSGPADGDYTIYGFAAAHENFDSNVWVAL